MVNTYYKIKMVFLLTHIYAFDIYYINKKDVRSFPFSFTNSLKYTSANIKKIHLD